MPEIERNDEEWKAQLGSRRYAVLRRGGTERPFTGELLAEKRGGTFVCGGCGAALFRSDAKFESGSGWPSFSEPVATSVIDEVEDRALGMRRVEIRCHRCGGHLGHVFDDGPAPTGLRYCVNSLSLDFTPADGEAGPDS